MKKGQLGDYLDSRTTLRFLSRNYLISNDSVVLFLKKNFLGGLLKVGVRLESKKIVSRISLSLYA